MKSDTKIFPIISMIISIFLLFYVFYKSEIFWNGEKRNYYLIYYYISIITIIFSIITFYLNKKITSYLIIILISSIFTIYLFEFYLTILPKEKKELNKKIKFYEQQTKKDFDTRSLFEIYREYKNEYKNTAIFVGPRYYPLSNIHSLSNISNSKTILCNENGYYSIYSSDRYGFNNPNEEWDANEIEYLLLGDSFTQGYCVNRGQEIASILRNLSKKSILNLGFGSNGPLTEYAALREYFKPNIKNILWFYYEGNDIQDLKSELLSPILTKYIKDLNFTQRLNLRQNEIDEITKTKMEKIIELNEQRIIENNFISRFVNFIKVFNLRNRIFTKSHIQKNLEDNLYSEFKEILRNANNFSKKNNTKFYFIYLPEYERYKTNYNDSSYLLIKKIVNELNIPFIDIHEKVFKKENFPLKLFPFEMNGHYNDVGYLKVANTIFKSILNE
jgi:hypothetical protein